MKVRFPLSEEWIIVFDLIKLLLKLVRVVKQIL